MGDHVPGGMMTAAQNGTEPGLQSGPHFFDSNILERNAWAVLAAAGAGTRLAGSLGGELKQFYIYKGAPLYWHSALVLARCACVKGIVFVFPEAYCERERERIARLCETEDPGLPWLVTAGGGTRSESTRNGVSLLPPECTEVFIHDAARPFLSPDLIWRLYQKMRPSLGALIPGLMLTDTVKQVDENELVLTTPARASLRAVQTPQLFNAPLLKKLYESPYFMPEKFTDDAAMLEEAGHKVEVVEGDPLNVKITNPSDLKLLMKEENVLLPCTGFGYDAHRFGEGRPLVLGGLRIPGPYKLLAHSDGDVLLHALTDAILGCGGLGDIGGHFPDSNPALDGMASAVFVDHALTLIRKKGLRLTHLDMTIVAQKPKLEPYKREIAKNVARLCALDIDAVNVKATTEEGLGFTGKLEGIKAYAVASAVRLLPADAMSF